MRILAALLAFSTALPLLVLAQQPAAPVPKQAGQADDDPVLPAVEEKGPNQGAQLVLNTGGHSAPIRAASFTRDGERLITIGADRTIQVWGLKYGVRKKVSWLPAGNGERGVPAYPIFSPDGRYLAFHAANATGTGDPVRHLYVLDLQKWKLHATPIKLEADGPLAFTADSKLLALAMKGRVQFWDHVKVQPIGQIALSKPGIPIEVALTPNGQRLAVTMARGRIDVYELTRNQNEFDGKFAFEVGDSPYQRGTWGDDDTLLSVGESTLRAWSAKSATRGQKLKDIPLPPLDERLQALKFPLARPAPLRVLPGTKQVLIGWSHALPKFISRVGALVVDWERGTGRAVGPTLHANLKVPHRISISADGKYGMLTGGVDYGIYLFDLKTGAVQDRLLGKVRSVERDRFAWTKDGKSIAWGIGNSTEELSKEAPRDRRLNLYELELRTARDKKENRADALLHKLGELRVSRLNKKTIQIDGRPQPTRLNLKGAGLAFLSLLAGDLLTVGGIDYYDSRTGKLRYSLRQPHTFDGFAVTPDGRYVLVRTMRQTLQMINPRAPKEKCHLLSACVAGNDWIVWTPEGYYAATPGGEKLMGCVVNNGLDQFASFQPADRFHERLYRPDIVKLVLDKESVAAALKAADGGGQATRSVESLLPPYVSVTIVGRTKLPDVTVKVRAVAAHPEQPVVALRLFLDGKPLPSPRSVIDLGKGKGRAKFEDEWALTLPEGAHTITAVARSPDSSALSEPVAVANINPAKLPILHVLAIGVSKYDQRPLTLNYAAADAEAIAKAFQGAGKGTLFGDIQVKTLLDRDANKRDILYALDALHKVKPNDLVIVFFAGHGVKDKSAYYLLTREAKVDALAKTTLSGAELSKALRTIPCRVVLMLDSCYAAGFGDGRVLNKAGLRPATDDMVRTLTDDEVGIVVMGAAMGTEKAAERKDHGLFTRAVLEALTPAKDVRFNSYNHRLYVHHLYAYVFDQVAQQSEDQQHPFLSMPACVVESFPLAQFKNTAIRK